MFSINFSNFIGNKFFDISTHFDNKKVESDHSRLTEANHSKHIPLFDRQRQQ